MNTKHHSQQIRFTQGVGKVGSAAAFNGAKTNATDYFA